MAPRTLVWLLVALLANAGVVGGAIGAQLTQPTYAVEQRRESSSRWPYSPEQTRVLELLNRTDADHLPRLDSVVVPQVWSAEPVPCPPSSGELRSSGRRGP